LKTLSSVKGFGTLHHGLVNGAVDLHSLLDDCFREGIRSSALWMSVTANYSPSNGFINASLAIVAEAPLSAIRSPFVSHAYPGLSPRTKPHTSC
jgi:hypothetical protein